MNGPHFLNASYVLEAICCMTSYTSKKMRGLQLYSPPPNSGRPVDNSTISHLFCKRLVFDLALEKDSSSWPDKRLSL